MYKCNNCNFHRKSSGLFSWILVFLFVFVLVSTAQTGCSPRKDVPKNGGEPGQPKPADRVFDVLIVKSPGSLKFGGWKAERELKAAEAALYRLGVDYAIIEEEELKKAQLPCKILLLPNTRCMNAEALEGIRKFAHAGGKVLATYMSAYRDENNQSPGLENNFLLEDIFGVDFMQWSQSPGKFAFISPDDGKEKIQLGRNQAMVVRPHDETEILAYWLNAAGKPELAGGVQFPAVTYNPKLKVIYCGEDIFSPENSESSQVLAYIGDLLEKLEKGVVKKKVDPKKTAITPTFSIPAEIISSVKPTGDTIIVGISGKIQDTFLLSPNPVEISSSGEFYKVRQAGGDTYLDKITSYPVQANKMLYIMSMAVQGKEPYVNIYDEDKKNILRIYASFTIHPVDGTAPMRLIRLNQNGTYNYKAYRGELVFTTGKGGLALKNKLSMDEYLCGVVPKEMPASYPEEALKSMAVVARTFARSILGKHKAEGFDVCDTVHCQVYEGVMGERISSNRAVAATSGEIITHNDKPAFTPFHAVCGGFGADVASVWKEKSPVLTGGFDGTGKFNLDLSDDTRFRGFIDNPPDCYCKKAGRFRWVQKYSLDEMKKLLDESLGKLNSRGAMDIGKLYSIEIKSRSKDGRAQLMEIVASTGTYQVQKDKMRWITSGGKIGTAGLPSTFFYVKKDKDNFIFTGGGWGHGVGMCQEGARGMAEGGAKYPDIIKHYYHDTQLKDEY